LFPAINKLGRLPATSVINSPRCVAANCIALADETVHSTQWRQILAQNRDFCLPLHSTPLLGGSRRNIATPTFGTEKLVWWGYPIVKTFWTVYSFWQNVRTWHTDGRTDRRIPHDG